MACNISLIVSVRKIPPSGHSLRLADLESPSGTRMRRMFLSEWSAPHITCPLNIPSYSRNRESHYYCLFCPPLSLNPSFRLRLVPCSARSSLSDCGCCEWMQPRMWGEGKGWVGGQAAASQPQQSTSASAGRPCGSPCVRECRCLSQAGMGSAMENRNCMRSKRDATEAERHFMSRFFSQSRRERCWEKTRCPSHSYSCYILSHTPVFWGI